MLFQFDFYLNIYPFSTKVNSENEGDLNSAYSNATIVESHDLRRHFIGLVIDSLILHINLHFGGSNTKPSCILLYPRISPRQQ